VRDLKSITRLSGKVKKGFDLTIVNVLGHHLPKFTRKLDSSRSSSTNDEAQ